MKLIAKLFGNKQQPSAPLTINDVVSQFSKMIKDLNTIADNQRASITSCDLSIQALEVRKLTIRLSLIVQPLLLERSITLLNNF